MDYNVTVKNQDTGDIETFGGSDVNDVLQKASNYSLNIKVGNNYYTDSENRKKLLELKKNFANLYTKKFSEDFENKRKILEGHGKSKNEFWQKIDSNISKEFSEKPPLLDELPIEPQQTPINPEPQTDDIKYKINKTIIDLISKNRYNN